MSSINIKATSLIFPFNSSLKFSPSYLAKSNTLFPSLATFSILLSMFLYASFNIISGAPNIKAPSFSNSTADHFRFDENGILFLIFKLGLLSYLSNNAFSVAFPFLKLWTIAAIILSMSFIFSLFKHFTSVTFKSPLVIVPVLSKHKTSTLAKTSVAGNSWISVSHLESLITATTKVALVKSTRPSGTIPTIPETEPKTASCQLFLT